MEEKEKEKFKPDKKSDIWSLGLVFYDIFYGKKCKKIPFNDIVDVHEKLQVIKMEGNKIYNNYCLWEEGLEITENIRGMIESCLQVNMKNRPSCDEIMQKLMKEKLNELKN